MGVGKGGKGKERGGSFFITYVKIIRRGGEVNEETHKTSPSGGRWTVVRISEWQRARGGNRHKGEKGMARKYRLSGRKENGVVKCIKV